MNGVIQRAYFCRCTLILEADDGCTAPPRLVNADGSFAIEPPRLAALDGRTAWKLDFASGFRGRPIPDGEWTLTGLSCADIAPIEADFSGDGTVYTVRARSEDGCLRIRVAYVPKKASFGERITDGALQLLYQLGRLTRGNGPRVLFTSESRRDASGNMAFVLDAADRLGLRRRMPILFSFKTGSRTAFFAATAFRLGRCDTVVIDDYHPLIYHIRLAEGTRVFQLWHACGAYKTVGYSRAGKRGAPRIDGNTHRCYTHAIVSGDGVRSHYAEAFGIPEDRVYATGVPRTDIFFHPAHAKAQRDALLRQLPQTAGKQVVLFAPTFRGDGKHSAYYPADKLDFPRLAELCRQTNRFVLFKMHPFVTDFALPEGYSDVFADVRDRREINDLLFSADVLITDYSSVLYEASLLGLNVLLYVFDLDEYTASRDFYEPFERYAAGKAVRTFDELLGALRDGDFEPEKRAAFRAYSMDRCDGHASERVARLIFDRGAQPKA